MVGSGGEVIGVVTELDLLKAVLEGKDLLSLPKTLSAISGKDLRQVAPAAPPR